MKTNKYKYGGLLTLYSIKRLRQGELNLLRKSLIDFPCFPQANCKGG